MAAFDLVNNMNDVALRPRLLRTLIRDHIPDDKHPFGSPSQLTKVISMLKTHNLLSESYGELEDQKLIGNWKSAVDSWVDRLLLLLSNDMPDKCWAGICLLGVTSQECSSDRFLASYSDWFQKLLSRIQFSAASHFVKVASCASLSDLLIRLGGFSNVKKDGTAHAGKLIQPVLKLLSDDNSEAIWDGAVHLLCTIITFFPFSIGRHYESVEAAIASKILSGTCSFDMLKKFANCLALLPKSRGDEDSWSLMMQKILIWINNHLNDTFQGFEEETRHYSEAMRLLLPPGKDVPPPFGGLTVLGEQQHNMQKRSEHVLTSSVSALMIFCSTMLTSSYPAQVTVPVRSLLALVERVLMVDASLPHSQRPFVTALQQEFLSSELPVLHLYSLELLAAIIKGVRSQLLPHAASIVRLISVYFSKCVLPELRAKIYSITKILLLSMGVGMGLCLEQDVLKNAFLDLSPIYENGGTSSINSKPSTETLPRPSHKKRKHGSTTGSLEEGHDGNLEVESQKNHSTALISLRIAALEALEALLTVGGTPKSSKEHPDINLLLINIVRHSSKGGWASEDRSKQEIGTKLAEFCAHALLALEVLLHPRALSVDDFSTMKSKSDEVHDEIAENIYTDNISWLENGKETEAAFCYPAETLRYNDIPSETFPVSQDINLSNGSNKEIPVGSKWEPAAANAGAVIQGSGDELMVESHQLPESRPLNHDFVPANTDGPAGFQKVNESISSGSGTLQQAGDNTASGQDMDISMAKTDKFSTVGTSSTLDPEKGKAIASKLHHESDSDEYPDLLDVGPDSDSNQEDE
ncbi:hypothetical protein F8388_002551 [Cannabis sativa]|uniref:Pre-rRNA-processing protein RIX1 N-terminal domain-containing protein n=1 Tax=Cannabis sativa TaxID=3483 RepID=A0A7J6FDU7_CANSA|nr:hypothetical protein F8388_002551 [Cannabis sativa]